MKKKEKWNRRKNEKDMNERNYKIKYKKEI